jgi:hypothetical protein
MRTRLSRNALTTAALVLALAAFGAANACAQERTKVELRDDSGFRWLEGKDDVRHTVERKLVKKGIPSDGHPIDRIEPIDAPAFYPSHAAAKKDLDLRDGDRVLGLVIGDDVRTYLPRMLDRHEVVNDTVGGKPVAVLW